MGTRQCNSKHGKSRTRTYRKWAAMKMRCCNEDSQGFHAYGARGISLCKRWRNEFLNFYDDMGEAPPGMTIERIDNDKGYSKDNCRWATMTEQARNRRGNTAYSYNGVTKPLSALAEEAGLRYRTVWQRLKSGWPLDEALSIKIMRREQSGTIRKRNRKDRLQEFMKHVN